MFDADDLAWMEWRIEDRAKVRRQKRIQRRNPELTVIDASGFGEPLSKLAETLTHVVERDGPSKVPHSNIPFDIAMILRQVRQTYDLIRFLNSDERRDNDPHYRQAYSFVVLPLVRTMIDGLYNCTAMLADPVSSRAFRISGLYRYREALTSDEEKFSKDVRWRANLDQRRKILETIMRADGISSSDLDDRGNKWPLLGEYLGRGQNTPLKDALRKLTLGLWKEYSSISHASYDGLISVAQHIAPDKLLPESRGAALDNGERGITQHLVRTAVLLTALLTELQHFFSFEGAARIDERLMLIWKPLLQAEEARELFETRYKSMLRFRE